MTSPFNRQLIEEFSASLISRIKGLIVAGMTFEQAYAKAKESSCAGAAVWAIVDAEFSKPGVYCGKDEKDIAIYTGDSVNICERYKQALELLRSIYEHVQPDGVSAIDGGWIAYEIDQFFSEANSKGTA